MRVFVDVGGHYGETLHVALDPRWGFARVFTLEPARACQTILRAFRDPRLTVEQIGLSNRNTHATLYGAGLLGASVHQDKRQKTQDAAARNREDITLVRTSEWFEANIPEHAEVYLKLNCEGSECEILSDLLDSPRAGQIRSLYVDFDVRKIESLAGEQAVVESRLQQARIDYVSSESLGACGNEAVERWLQTRIEASAPRLDARLRYSLRMYAPMYVRLSMLSSALLPRRVHWWLGHRFGRIARASR